VLSLVAMSDTELAEGTVLGGGFRLSSVLSRGGKGTVYEAVELASGKPCAVKVLHAEHAHDEKVRAQFAAEATRASAIASEHAVKILAHGLDEGTGRPFVAMELLRGRTLAAHVAKKGALDVAEALSIGKAVLHALAGAHARGTVHRDLKPDNVFLAEPTIAGTAYHVKVLFAGMSKVVSEAKGNTTAAMDRPLWMAPEQTETGAAISPATDVWTVGLLLFWMLTGRPYWKTARDMGSAMMSLLREVMFDPIVPAALRARELGCEGKIPPGFDAWFARAVAKSPLQRYPTAYEARLDLDAKVYLPPPPPRPAGHTALGGAPTMVAEPTAQHGAAQAAGATVLGAPDPSALAGPSANFAAPAAGATTPSPTQLGAPDPSVFASSGHGQPGPSATLDTGYGAPQGVPPPPAMPPAWAPAPAVAPTPTARPSRALVVGGVAAGLLAVAGLVTGGVLAFGGKGKSKKKKWDDDDPSPSPTVTAEPAKPPVVAWADTDCPVPVTSKDPTWGERAAPVTLVQFSDFECPFCAKARTTVSGLQDHYGPAVLRVVWKNNPLPFHKNARPAAEAALAVHELGGNAAFWKFHDAAFAGSASLGDDQYRVWATQAGVDASKLSAPDLLARASLKVTLDMDLAKEVDAKGTPTFFVNGARLTGAQSLDKFKTTIDAQASAAAAEVAKGTPADRVYVTLTKRNYEIPAKPSPARGADATVYKVPVGGSPVLGPSTALVTVIEVCNFESPFCKRVPDTTKRVRDKLGSKVRFVWKDLPLSHHKKARMLSSFAREVRAQKGDAQFWTAHDKLFAGQLFVDDAELKLVATSLGVDPEVTLKAARDLKHKAALDADEQLMDELEVSTVPAFFVNGRKTTSLDALEDLVDEELPKAEAKVAAGASLATLYDDIIRDGKAGKALEVVTPDPPSADAPFRGAANARVVIQYWSDFQCPFCKRVEETLDELVREHGDKVKVVWRHNPLPFHKEAEAAAIAAEEVKKQKGNAGFWAFHKALFASQSGMTRDTILAAAVTAGASRAKVQAALDAKSHMSAIELDKAAAKKLSLHGTPSFVVGKYVLTGAQPYSKFKKALDRALADQP
jgi:protein-disulfide isomerase